MKNVFLGLAMAALTLACTSEQKASIDDASAPAAMEGCGTECSSEEAAACSAEKAAACSSEKAAECSSAKAAECTGEKKVCPVTGQEIN